MNAVAEYGIASGLRGFGELFTELRVRIVRTDENYAWVVTADLHDAGTPLTLNASQVRPMGSDTVTVISHRDGLVSFS